MSDTTKFSEFAAGINSLHNACTFRADCRKAEAQPAERDEEIARLRKILGWVAQEWHDCEICKQLDVKDAEIARLRDVLTSKGFVECGIPACDCRSWHHRYGLPERWAEIKEVLIDADVLNNDTGNLPLNAIKKLVSQLADARHQQHIMGVFAEKQKKEYDAEIARLREDALRYRWLRSYRGSSIDSVYNYGGNEELDGVIDAARKETK